MQITSFRGKYRFLSNFYPHIIKWQFLEFPSVENAYQAAKSTNPIVWEYFRKLTAGQAKRTGKVISNIRPDWQEINLQIMYDLCLQKFSNQILKDALLATEDAEIIEGNDWGDTFWGECPIGNGLNHLGKILMKIRENIKNPPPTDAWA